MPEMVTKQIVFIVTKEVEIPDTDAAEKKTIKQLTEQLEKLGYGVELEDVGLADEDDEDEEEDEDEFEDEEDEEDEDEEDEDDEDD